ncbi:VOC family protein [Simiduia agarivorans]|uniref:Glyoxalase/bleomycin resistance protein/dioxygenase n=1 Tax=Simiduia agarivorans (strain DSM 21679 / JCM 13881 / BCRC 17597 / SA1) TaxID=1117647 RepID=K4KNM7_SIMAS|nr:VOC family protein [Simiduia agarivorans]AFV00770.1 glyoxalase/bleomycin resistance protein/dioxygenase [Simiduia agarivorans SA1 = DSM 21679]
MQFNHFNLEVPADQLDKVKQFYQQVFGWREGDRPAFSRPGYWLYEGDLPILHLVQHRGGQTAAGNGALNHLAFRTSQLAAFRNTLDKLNIPYRQVILADAGISQLFFHDPTGLKLEVNGPAL